MKFFARFFENLQQDLKAFLYWCLVLTVFRITFIYIYISQLNGDYAEVPTALFLGFRLSMKTAGMLCLIGFVLASLPRIVVESWPAKKIRFIWHGLSLMFFSICFMARIPYYKIFNAAFNMMIINGAHDDFNAILITAIEEYQLLWRLPVAIAIGLILIVILRVVYNSTGVIKLENCKNQRLIVGLTMPFLVLFWIFVRYGGAFNYASSINWESAARLKSNLLNEAILDDGQALYRVRGSQKMLAKVTNVNISKYALREKIALIGGSSTAQTVDDAFLHTVKQPKLSQRPSNVFLIVGESFGEWPFLPQFKDLGLVDNMIALKNSKNSAYINTMLAHGSGTILAVNGLLTGVPDTGLFENHRPLSMKEKYAMGIGYIMQKLGYKTVFWYGGFSGWHNVKNFVMAQSFDEFHCADEFGKVGGNAWGCPDGVFFDKIVDYLAREQEDQKYFHLILTTSNHPPYTLDIDKMGFQREAVRKKLTSAISKSDEMLTELGHIWYADMTMGAFVKQAEKMYPDSLFVITGDHSERFTFAVEQDIRTLSAIPCIFYGKGVQKNWFDSNSLGCHMQMPGTMAEILGEPGFKYSAMMPNMFEDNKYVFNHRLISDKNNIFTQDKFTDKVIKEHIAAMRIVGSWRVLKGKEM